jgi:subtilisin family serine protease
VFNGFRVADLSGNINPIEEMLDTLRQHSAVDAGTHVYHTSTDGIPFVPTGELYVEFGTKTSILTCQKLIDSFGLEVIETRGGKSAILRITKGSPNPLKVANALQETGKVDVAEPELSTPARCCNFFLPSDSQISKQWHLRNTGTIGGSQLGLKLGADAGVVAAWERAKTLGDANTIVAVIDDGFDLHHHDLTTAGKIVAPWDFTRNNNQPVPGDNPKWNASTSSWLGDWHGTACAGVAVGAPDGIDIVGAAPGCRLMPVRWGVSLSDAEIENWFNYVTTQGASVVSCSWGAAAQYYALSTRQFKAIEQCATKGRGGLGCVIVFAAGNENRDINAAVNSKNGFAIHPNVISVAACTSRDERSDYSNFGSEISVCAPSSGSGGRRVCTSDVSGTFSASGRVVEAGYSVGPVTMDFGGTSSSTPLVAGVAALLLSIKPSLTAVEVKNILQNTSRKIGAASDYAANGHSKYFGYGCVNADEAIKAVLSPTAMSKAARPTRVVRRSKR